MKQLSIEQKAKAYDEIIGKAKKELNACDSQDCDAARQIFRFFPELKESEDEIIRKVLIELVKCNEKSGYKLLNNVPTSSILAWLEKQGEQKLNGTFVNVDDVREDFIDEVYRVLDADPTNDRANQIIDAFDSLPTVTIEKQGENHDDKYNIAGIKSKHAEGKLGEMIKNLKSANEVESKFKSGDWIVRELDNSVHQVKNVLESESNGKYAYDLTDGGYIPTSHDSDYHLWTILDAKPGDILASKDGKSILIFRHFSLDDDDDTFASYYSITFSSYYMQGYDEYNWLNTNFVPATKEQRDLLFQKMEEAGYEWDSEKKQLRKIEYEQI